ncbi:MAG: hypothetical protein P9L94_01705 [Candidatus Hinthialibacter antarcticus]|nr:hypothetical protein [Candidatus Hinthialibacter antarcticus]
MTEETSIFGGNAEDNFEFKKKQRRWLSGHFDADLPPCISFDLEPVTDIPIRLAVEEGAIRNKRDLCIFKTTDEWREFPKGTVIIAQLLEENAPYALFVGDGRKLSAIEKKILTNSQDEGESSPVKSKPKQLHATQPKVDARTRNRRRNLRARLGKLGVQRTSPPSRKRAQYQSMQEWKAVGQQKIFTRRRQQRSKK